MDPITDPNASWTSVGGWSGGTIMDVLVAPGHPPTILAASRAGLYASTDWGATWRRRRMEQSDPSLLALARAPGDDAPPLFASTASGRLYRSSDGGWQWRELSAWAGLGLATALAVSPDFAQDQTLFAATDAGPFRSQDGGRTWERSTFGLLDVHVLDILCVQDGPGQGIWVGTAHGGLYRSRNGGRSWRDAGQGLPDAAVQCLAAGEGILYAGLEQGGLYRSTDGGASWRQAGAELAGVSVNALALDASNPTSLVAGTESGIFASQDGGASWRLAEGGSFLTLAHGPGGRVVAGAWQQGVFLSENGGRSWRQVNGQGPERLEAHAPPLALLTPNGTTFLVDMDGVCVWSENRGGSWQTVAPGELDAPETWIYTLAGGGSPEAFTVFAGGEQLHRREPDGTWSLLAPPAAALRLIPSPDYAQDRTLLLMDDQGGLHRSEDGGETWSTLFPPWQGKVLLNAAISPFFSQDRALYALTTTSAERPYALEIWQSADGGTSWIDLAALNAESPAVALLPLPDPEARPLALAVQNRFILLHTDGESGCLAVEQHFLPDEVGVTGLVTVPVPPGNHVLLAATKQGVWHSRDEGVTWRPLGRGLELPVVAVQMASEGLYAVTLGGGIWKLSPAQPPSAPARSGAPRASAARG